MFGKIFITQLRNCIMLVVPLAVRERITNELVYRQKIEDVDHLNQVLNRCWSMLSQELINGAIDQWSKRP